MAAVVSRASRTAGLCLGPIRLGLRHSPAIPLGVSVRALTSSPVLSSCGPEADLTAPNGVQWTQPLGLFIDNEFVESADGCSIATVNP